MSSMDTFGPMRGAIATKLSSLLVPQLCPMFWSEPPERAQIIWAHLPFLPTVTTENLGLAHHSSCTCRNNNSPVTDQSATARLLQLPLFLLATDGGRGSLICVGGPACFSSAASQPLSSPLGGDPSSLLLRILSWIIMRIWSHRKCPPATYEKRWRAQS